LKIKKTTTYDIGNPGPDLEQAQKYDDTVMISGIPTLSLTFD
jgi:hypothetical protein